MIYKFGNGIEFICNICARKMDNGIGFINSKEGISESTLIYEMNHDAKEFAVCSIHTCTGCVKVFKSARCPDGLFYCSNKT